ncbi:MAG: hypothetical protein HXX15_19535 [Rhodopseudomonas sp.]|uniref:hypothetical protein n=1 Tax=Rhodopseudomonas sp. TaxID=1078 RepID=UPI0017F6D838|nr:hypothetical protein [Rhodopseudomonas sp.]NVN88278.1 hypothetical protein [Rhodopseudomonas sp.]
MLRMTIFAVSLALAQWSLAGPAAACTGEKILFQENFAAADPVLWGSLPAHFQVRDGKVTVRPPAQSETYQFESGFAFEDADICLTVTLLETTDPTNSFGGLLFWVKDKANFYVLNVASIGYYQVRRKIAGQWVAPEVIGWTQTKDVKQGPNQPNTVRVTLKGQSVAIAINGNDVIRFRAQAPEAPSFVGLYAASAEAKADAWQFSNLKVTNVK